MVVTAKIVFTALIAATWFFGATSMNKNDAYTAAQRVSYGAMGLGLTSVASALVTYLWIAY